MLNYNKDLYLQVLSSLWRSNPLVCLLPLDVIGDIGTCLDVDGLGSDWICSESVAAYVMSNIITLSEFNWFKLGIQVFRYSGLLRKSLCIPILQQSHEPYLSYTDLERFASSCTYSSQFQVDVEVKMLISASGCVLVSILFLFHHSFLSLSAFSSSLT